MTLALSGSAAAASTGGWQLPKRPTWYWQLNGKIRFGLPVQIYDVDAFTTTAAEVERLHSERTHVICYVDVGTAENWRPDYSEFPQSVLGSPNGWPGEAWLDIRQLRLLEPIMAARFRLCQEKGFDAVEPNNMEAALNESGFPITLHQQLVYNEWVPEEVHSLHMAVLQKNDSEQTPQESGFFDGALSEECNQYWPECGAYLPYLESGRPVLNAEYKLKTQRFCGADLLAGISGARFNLPLNGRRFEPCWEWPSPRDTSTRGEIGARLSRSGVELPRARTTALPRRCTAIRVRVARRSRAHSRCRSARAVDIP